MLDIDTVMSKIAEPFGSWEMDIEAAEARFPALKIIQMTSETTIGIFRNKFLKIKLRNSEAVARQELKFMLLAGDCSVQPVGRVFDNGKLHGTIMNFETTLVPDFADLFKLSLVSPEFSLEKRLDIIYQLIPLITKLHGKGIAHGDIKTSNLLLNSAGKLLLCDFSESVVDSDENNVAKVLTTRYASRHQLSSETHRVTKTEDLYATGVTIWELYTGRIPFQDLDEDCAEDIIRAGIRVDPGEIEDQSVAATVAKYLNSYGDEHLPLAQAQQTCIVTQHTFMNCLCRDPPHTYTKLIKCEECVEQSRSVCPQLFATLDKADYGPCPQCTEN
ncbi:kinase-like domain-containing protein [Mycena floridula]|nr:kinase-like domain-containing protein [Mycena floridula]